MIKLAVVLIENKVEQMSTRESYSEIQDRLRVAVQRGGELALDKVRLEEEVDELRFNGPALWRDEVEAIDEAVKACVDSICKANTAEILSNLLNRCHHIPITSVELEHSVMNGLHSTNGSDCDD